MNNQFSFFSGGIKVILPTREVGLKDFINIIKSDKYKNQIIELRDCKKRDEQALLKSKLDFCIPSGVFSTRDSSVLLKDKMTNASGVLSLDVDEYEGDYKKLKEVIKADEFVAAVFDSPREKLKIFINVPPEKDNDLFWRRWVAATIFFGKRWGCEFDELKDITRACFVSWDENAYYNLNSKVYETIADKEVFNKKIKSVNYDVLTEGVEKKNRNTALLSLGCSLLHKKVEPSYIEELMKTANKKNKPPLDEKELQRIIKNVFKYKKDEQKDLWLVGDNGKRKLIQKNLAFNLMNVYKFITVGDDKFDVFYYNDGIYHNNGKKLIAQESQIMTEGSLKINDVNEVIGHIQRQTFNDRNVLYPTNQNLVCVNNGILDIENFDLKKHTSDMIFTQKIDSDYKPDSDCPKIKQFLKDILSEDDIPILQEFIGYCLYRKSFIKKALILVGDKNTGKTTLINLLVKFIGEDNTSGVSLHDIMYNKFSVSRMENKLLNFYDDLSFKDIKDTGRFKIITGGGYISAEKKFGESFEFMNYAKLVFATNKIAAVEDTEDLAYYDRWIILFFENVFDDNNESTNKRIIDELTTKKELDGMLVWALEGLKKVLVNNKICYNISAEENRLIMERSSSSLSAFVQNALIQQNGSWVSKDDLYNIYSEFVNQEGGEKITKDMFGKNLLKKVKYIVDGRKDTTNKKSVRGWLNVGLNTTFNTFSQNISNKNIIHDIPIIIDETIIIKQELKKGIKGGMLQHTIDNQLFDFDPKLIQYQKCSIENCPNYETNPDSEGKAFCQDHWEKYAKK